MLTDRRHKLIEYACGATQLFDLVDDPFEMRNLADRGESKAALSDLRQRLVQTAREWADPLISLYHHICDFEHLPALRAGPLVQSAGAQAMSG